MKRSTLILAFLICSITVFSQHSDGYGVNLPKFYKQKLHFGFTISGNQTDFRLNPKPNSMLPDTIIGNVRYGVKTVYSQSAPGFGLGPVIDFRLHEYVRFRLTPNISFSSRKINYRLTNAGGDSSKVFQKTVESVFIIAPAEIKVQSKRLGNFSAYVIGGGGYSLDLNARKKAAGSSGAANQLDDNVKLQRDDVFYSAGAGVDFYLQYFKFGLELKLLIGTKNLLKPENSIFTNSLDKARSRIVQFTLTFEG